MGEKEGLGGHRQKGTTKSGFLHCLEMNPHVAVQGIFPVEGTHRGLASRGVIGVVHHHNHHNLLDASFLSRPEIISATGEFRDKKNSFKLFIHSINFKKPKKILKRKKK